MELFVYFLAHVLLMETLTVDTHFLNEATCTDTGSFIFFAPSGLLLAISTKQNIT